MARVSVLTGLVLIALGLLVTLASASQSVTSLIPAFIGAVFVLLGVVGTVKPSTNHHAMHAAAALSLLAILGSAGTLIGRGAGGWALLAQVVTIAVTTVFLLLAVRSFREARRGRAATASS